jgi:hypothetical protein
MRITLRNQYLSLQRFNRYLLASGGDNQRAKRLYSANIRLAQAFHPLLSQFEVVLRNALNNVLSIHFSDPDWIINQKTGFMSDPSLAHSRYYLRSCVLKTEESLTRRRVPVTAGKIISDQTFGFWLAFLYLTIIRLSTGKQFMLFHTNPLQRTEQAFTPN